MVPATGSKVGKKSLLKTSAAAVPYRKKSYHSMSVPMNAAAMTRFELARGGVASLDNGLVEERSMALGKLIFGTIATRARGVSRQDDLTAAWLEVRQWI